MSQDELLKAAIDITKAQATVREMKPDEVQEYLKKTHETLTNLSGKSISTPLPFCVGDHAANEPQNESFDTEAASNPLKSIKEKHVSCLICGKDSKTISKKHLASHDLTVEAYLEKFGFPKGTKLVCKKTQRDRRNRMKEMRLWERRGRSKQNEGNKVEGA